MKQGWQKWMIAWAGAIFISFARILPLNHQTAGAFAGSVEPLGTSPPSERGSPSGRDIFPRTVASKTSAQRQRSVADPAAAPPSTNDRDGLAVAETLQGSGALAVSAGFQASPAIREAEFSAFQ